jgi:hypothetical protein
MKKQKLTPIQTIKKREIPIAAPVTVQPKENFNFTKPYFANPETDEARFEEACREADTYAVKTGYDTLVFKAPHGFYFTRESKFCRVDIANGAMTALYEAKAEPRPLDCCGSKGTLHKIKCPAVGNQKTWPKTYQSGRLGRVTIPEQSVEPSAEKEG